MKRLTVARTNTYSVAMFSTCSEFSFKFQIPTVATAISWDPQQFQPSTSNLGLLDDVL